MHKRTLFFLIILIVAAKLAVDHQGDTDTFWQLRLGMDLLDTRQMRTHALHSWTVQGSWPAFDWLGQLLWALSFLPLGFTSLALMKICLCMTLGALMFVTTANRTLGNWKATILAAFAMLFLAANNFSARPLLMGMVLFALEVFLIHSAQVTGRLKRLWWLFPIFILWGNIHGSWPIGLFPIAILGVECLFPRLTLKNAFQLFSKTSDFSLKDLFCLGSRPPFLTVCLVGVLCLLAQFVTPAPWNFFSRPFLWTSQGAENLMDEWSASTFASMSLWALIAIAALFAFGLRKSFRDTTISLPALAAFGVLFVVAVLKVRLVAYFAIFGCPILGELLAGAVSRKGFNSARQNRLFCALIVGVLAIPTAFNVVTAEDKALVKIPTQLVRAIEEKGLSQTRGFNHFDWGGYLVFRNIPTFVDGRLEPFLKSGVFQEYLTMEETGDVRALEKKGIRWALVNADWPMAQNLMNAPGWTWVGEDNASVPKAALFIRTEEEAP